MECSTFHKHQSSQPAQAMKPACLLILSAQRMQLQASSRASQNLTRAAQVSSTMAIADDFASLSSLSLVEPKPRCVGNVGSGTSILST
eukprot:2767950-Amphidinium_carterae.1